MNIIKKGLNSAVIENIDGVYFVSYYYNGTITASGGQFASIREAIKAVKKCRPALFS